MWFRDILARLTKPSLVRSAKAGKLNTVTRILSEGGSVDVRDGYGRTALMEAAREGHIEIVKLLLEHGADNHKQSYSRKSAIDYALAWGHQDILFIQQGSKTSDMGK